MKKLLLLLAIAVAFTFTAVAQETGSQTTTTQSTTTSKTKTKKSEKAAKEATIQGCLAAGTEPNTWMLTKGKKSYTVSGQDMSQHVGHEVKVTGEVSGKTIKATNVEHVADTCTATAAGGKTKKEKKGAAATPPGF